MNQLNRISAFSRSRSGSLSGYEVVNWTRFIGGSSSHVMKQLPEIFLVGAGSLGSGEWHEDFRS